MRMYRRPTTETIRFYNDDILDSWNTNSEYNPEDVSYSKRRGFILEDDEE